MERYSFFDAVLGEDGLYDRLYSSADIASYFASFIGNGVYANPANSLMVKATSEGNTIHVENGKAWINGYFYELDESGKNLTIELGDAMYPRIDSVVLALDLQKRMIELFVKKGSPSASPKANKPLRTADRHEIILANVYVEKGLPGVRQADITDTRMNNDVCGIVSGVVDQIDTKGLFSQYEDRFQIWFEGIKGILEGDVAGQLATQMQTVNETVSTMETKVSQMPTIRTGKNAPDNSIGVDGDIYFQILE